MMEAPIKLLCAKEVADRLNICPRTAAKLLRSGKIDGFKLSGKYWRTTELHVEAYVTKSLFAQRVQAKREVRRIA